MRNLIARIASALRAIGDWCFGDNLTDEERQTVLGNYTDPQDPDHIVYVLAR